ncbi:MAG: site-specific integrase [Segetibacter sp.]
MKQLKYSISLFWDARAMNTVSLHSRIMLTVNLKGVQFRLSLKLRSTKSDFDKAVSSARTMSDSVRELKREMDDYVLKAENVFARLPSVDKEMFIRLFKSETDLCSNYKTNVFSFFELKLVDLKAENRKGSYDLYKSSLANLKGYKSSIHFEDITERWLKGYQLYLKGNGNSNATVSLRVRVLKIIYNVAVKQGFVSAAHKPFQNVSTGSTAKSKAVLYPVQLEALWEYQPVSLRERRAKATFFFLYLSNGMNQKDMAYLKYSSIKGDSFVFIREKTKYTKSELHEIKVYLNDELKSIIAKWGNKDKSGYVFPLLKGKTVFEQETFRARHKRTCNKSLANIGKKLGFEVHLCLNLARHSFATMHKILGTPTSFISDAMGHTNSAMTEHYMKSLPDENLKEMSGKLLSFV